MKKLRIYTDGSGQNCSGKGSGFAFWIEGQPTGQVARKDGLTNNEAEYLAVIGALGAVPKHSDVEILTDSELVSGQMSKGWAVREPRLLKLVSQIKKRISTKHLKVSFVLIPRTENKVDRLLRRRTD